MKILYIMLSSAIFAGTAFSQRNDFQSISESNLTATGVSLFDFEAVQKNNSVALSWNAASENNMGSYEVEKSVNGSSFMSMGSIAAQNNTTPYKYTYLDATPVAGINYYRLRSFDNKGNAAYSNIIKVDNHYRKTEIIVMSNPVRGGILNFQLSNFDSGRYIISLYSNAGQKVFARSMDFSDGTFTETINLPQNITSGSYFLQVTDGENRINKQIVLQ